MQARECPYTTGAPVTVASIEGSFQTAGFAREEMKLHDVLPSCQYRKDVGGYHNTCLT